MFQAFTNGNISDNVGRPDNTSTEDRIRCFGMPCDQWKRIQKKMLVFRAMAAESDGIMFDIQVRL